MTWLKTFATVLAWPVGIAFALTGAMAMFRHADLRFGWPFVVGLLIGAVLKATWATIQARERALEQ